MGKQAFLVMSAFLSAVFLSSLNIFSDTTGDHILIFAAGLLLLCLGFDTARYRVEERDESSFPYKTLLIPGTFSLLLLLSVVLSAAPLASFVGTWFEQGSGLWLFALLAVAIAGYRVGTDGSLPAVLLALTLLGGALSSSFLFSGVFNGESGFLLGNVGVVEAFAIVGALSFLGIFERSGTSSERIVTYVAMVGTALFLIFVGSFISLAIVIVACGVFMISRFILSRAPLLSFKGIGIGAVLLALLLLRVEAGWEFKPFIAEYRPNLAVTSEVVISTLSMDVKTFLLGVGPIHFSSAWRASYPQGAVLLPFWNEEIRVGYSALFTKLVELGVLLPLLFTGLCIIATYFLLREALREGADAMNLKLSFSLSFLSLSSLYVWSVPEGSVDFMLLFLAGILSGLVFCRRRDYVEKSTVYRRLAFFAAGVLLVGLSAWGAYAHHLYEKGVRAFKTENGEQGLSTLARAADLFPASHIPQTLSEAYQQGIDAALTEDSQIVAVRADGALVRAQQAVERNPASFSARITLASIYARRAALGEASSFELALQEYRNAQSRAPRNPLPLYLTGQLLYMNDRLEEARASLLKALELKPNYTEALELLEEVTRAARSH